MLKINSQKGSIEISSFAAVIIIALITAVAAVFIVIKYYRMLDAISLNVGITPTIIPAATLAPVLDEIMETKIYKNTEYGFEFKYPNNFYSRENYWSDWNKKNSIITLSNKNNFELEELSFLFFAGIESDINDKLIRHADDETAQLTAKKLDLESLEKSLNTKIVGIFAGDPPWGYYSVYIKIPNSANTGLLISARIHQADDPGYGGNRSDLISFKQILSTLKIGRYQ